jgi:hypothetical protein
MAWQEDHFTQRGGGSRGVWYTKPSVWYTKICVWFTLGATLSSSGCGGGAAKGTYTLEVSGYGSHVGQKLELKVKEQPSNRTVGSFSAVVPAAGALTVTVANVLEDGKTYHADYYADFDMNGAYTPPSSPTPTPDDFPDHQWRRVVQGSSAGLRETHAHDRSFTDISPF